MAQVAERQSSEDKGETKEEEDSFIKDEGNGADFNGSQVKLKSPRGSLRHRYS